MTLSPPSFDRMATVSSGDFKCRDDEDGDGGATEPSPSIALSKHARRPDMDDATPPPTNPRRDLQHVFGENETDRPTSSSSRSSSSSSSSSNEEEEEATTIVNEATTRTVPPPEEEDPEAESIALARMLMEQEAIESYGALSADYLRYNADQFSQEDLAALQAAMAEDEGSDDNGEGTNEQPFSYDVMLRLGESIGDVKRERWNLVAQSQIEKLEEFKFIPSDVKGKDENDCHVKCLVCQFAYEEEESLKRLPCGHAFHSDCVAQWLKDNDICPYCRQTIVNNDEDNNKE